MSDQIHDTKPEIDISDAMRVSFSSSMGVVCIQPNMPDAGLLAIIKKAASYGKPFTVIPAKENNMTALETRHEEAVRLVHSASDDTVENMTRRDWHRCTEILDEDSTVIETEDQLGDPDYSVAVTRTCTGYIVWTKLIGLTEQ